MMTLPTDAHYHARGCGELFAAIIQLAYHDVFAPVGYSGSERQHNQREAIALLTARRGEWAAHRNFLCTAIGIDGNAVAQHVRDVLEGRATPKLKVAGQQPEGEMSFTHDQIEAARASYSTT